MIVQYWITTPTGSRMLRRSQRQFHLRWRLEQKAWKAETNVLWHSSTIVCDMSENCRSVGMLPSWLGACAFTASIPFTWSTWLACASTTMVGEWSEATWRWLSTRILRRRSRESPTHCARRALSLTLLRWKKTPRLYNFTKILQQTFR